MHLQAEYDKGTGGRLQKVATLLSRPVRIARGQTIENTEIKTALFEVQEELALYEAALVASSQTSHSMGIGEFLQVRLQTKLDYHAAISPDLQPIMLCHL